MDSDDSLLGLAMQAGLLRDTDRGFSLDPRGGARDPGHGRVCGGWLPELLPLPMRRELVRPSGSPTVAGGGSPIRGPRPALAVPRYAVLGPALARPLAFARPLPRGLPVGCWPKSATR